MHRWKALATALGLSVGCANSQAVNRCAPEPWQGECQLANITKVEDAEFPTPHVVLEATYRPVPNPNYPGFTPGALTERSWAKAEHELLLYDFIEAHPRVACRAEAPPNGACTAPKIAISLPPFDPELAEKNAPAPKITGCAQIEATSTQDKLQRGQNTQTFIAQKLSFAQDSAELPPDADALTAQVAKMMADRPGIECLGVVGQITSGESPSLAERRANAVRDLLGAHGVALTRLLTIGATAKVFGNGSRPADPDPNDRRVGFSVLIERPIEP